MTTELHDFYIRVRFGEQQGEITIAARDEQDAIERAKAKLPKKRWTLREGLWLVERA